MISIVFGLLNPLFKYSKLPQILNLHNGIMYALVLILGQYIKDLLLHYNSYEDIKQNIHISL
jgi:hypothetical protein